jgi:hypothetical protein
MRIERRLTVLAHIYGAYDRFCGSLENLACRKFCADCCSRDVTMTTLEGLYLLKGLDTAQQTRCLAALAGNAGEGGFRPRWTTNQIAAFCREGGEPPEDVADHDTLPCPLLVDKACTLYGLRPFGCRCMVSRQVCGKRGYADLDDWVLSVNTVFLQMIEHLDRPGFFGNLQDVLQALTSKAWRSAYENGQLPTGASGLIANHPAPVLMVPPEHQAKMGPILADIQQELHL